MAQKVTQKVRSWSTSFQFRLGLKNSRVSRGTINGSRFFQVDMEIMRGIYIGIYKLYLSKMDPNIHTAVRELPDGMPL